jgi:hypothetical protein
MRSSSVTLFVWLVRVRVYHFYEKKYSTEQNPGNPDEERLLTREDDTALEALKVSNE